MYFFDSGIILIKEYLFLNDYNKRNLSFDSLAETNIYRVTINYNLDNT